jgi:hypothetical protein
MPYVFRPKIRRTLRSLVAAACLTGTLVAPSAAQATCPSQPVKQVFRTFGDSAYYALAPGGSFELLSTPWTHSGTSLALGNESYFLNSPTDLRSLAVPAGKSAMSPAFCVGMEHPTLRLMMRKATGTGGKLKVDILYPDGRTTSVKTTGIIANTGQYASWAPSPALDLANVLPFKSTTQTMNVRLRITADTAGAWAVDDVFIDPYRR